jgi:hypothetical protein
MSRGKHDTMVFAHAVAVLCTSTKAGASKLALLKDAKLPRRITPMLKACLQLAKKKQLFAF